MRYLFVLISLLIYSFANAQDLKNTEWIKIKAQRKDGSRIIDRINRGNEDMHYYFVGDTVNISGDMQYSFKQKYFLDNNTLSIGSIINYHIDSLNDVFMGVSEISSTGLSDDKINTYVFINADYIYDYLIKTHKLSFTPDSLIEYNDYFFPAYDGEIIKLFAGNFDYPNIDKSLKGSIIISGKGVVKDVSIASYTGFSVKQIKDVIAILNSTSGSWVMPPSPKLFQFKIIFSLNISGFGNGSGASFSFQRDTSLQIKYLTQFEENEAYIHYNHGLRLIKNGKFDKAATEFLACIRIDATYLNAYYDLGYSYQKMGNKELACETWRKLNEMEQKKGERLYNENCK